MRLSGGLSSTTRQCEGGTRSEEHTSELQSQSNLVCPLLLGKNKNKILRTCQRCTELVVTDDSPSALRTQSLLHRRRHWPATTSAGRCRFMVVRTSSVCHAQP